MISASLRVNFNLSKIKRSKENAISKALEMAMFEWETEAKMITTIENHVVTGRYRASINNNRDDGFPRQYSGPLEDGIHKKIGYKEFNGGSNVEYAAYLEKRFAIFSRALDNGRERMLRLFSETFVKNL